MIIDVHYHHMSAFPEAAAKDISAHAVHAANTMGKKVDPDAVAREAFETWQDPTGERLLAGMAEKGIDLTVICRVDDASNPRFKSESMQRGNKTAADIAKKYPDKVMALAGIDPRRPEAVDMTRQCMEEFGMKGVKYHADNGFYPCSPESYKVLEVLVENGGILLTHTSPLPPPSRAKYAETAQLSDLAVDFPDLKVIAAHMGYVDWRPWASLALNQPNLYGDLAMWVSFAFGNYNLFCQELRTILDYVGASKVLFGTDDPIYNTIAPTKDWIQLLKDLPNKAPDGIVFTREEIDAILGGNAAGILGLTA
jgi:predicted TIM-barrel fold metal-dependent hydrolase